MRNAVHFLGGSIAVYLLIAACSAGTKGTPAKPRPQPMASYGNSSHGGDTTAANAGTSNPNPNGSGAMATSGNASGGTLGGMIGDVMDPVDDADAAPATSGTRLRARYYVGEDGSKQFIGWHDKARNEDCYFSKATDGVLRCMPQGTATALGTYFADAGCTAQLFLAGASQCGAGAAKYGNLYDVASCTYVLQNITPIAPTEVYVGTPTSCAKTAPPSGYSFFTSPGPVTLAEFVAATEQVE